jgi:hypothetical protein
MVADAIPEVSFAMPPLWSGEFFPDQFVSLVSPETLARMEAPEAGHVEPDVNVQRLGNPEHLSVVSFALEFADGRFASYPQRLEMLVAGREAIRFSNVGGSIDRGTVMALFVSITSDSILKITIPVFESDLTSARTRAFEEVVSTLQFD